jgi:hypothetical protein
VTVDIREFLEARLSEVESDEVEEGWCDCDGHLRLRAARWSEHPDYRQEWAP